MRERTRLPTFKNKSAWISYKGELVSRLRTIYALSEEASLIESNLECRSMTVNSFLTLAVEWLKAYGVNVEWLLTPDNTKLEVVHLGRTWLPIERMELAMVCERLLKQLDSVYLKRKKQSTQSIRSGYNKPPEA